jgi:hypothetical protein
MLLGSQLERGFGFRIAGLPADRFVDRAALALNLGRMRLRLTAPEADSLGTTRSGGG